jgi:hypothetical protein
MAVALVLGLFQGLVESAFNLNDALSPGAPRTRRSTVRDRRPTWLAGFGAALIADR